MSSRSGSPSARQLGQQEPKFSLVPACKWSEADDAAFLSSAYGLTPDPWQALVLEAWLGRKADGKWSASRCGLAVPRQNGKNGILEVRELYGMIALGEKFLHTAHEIKTTKKAFARLKYFFGDRAGDPRARFPELNALVKQVRSTNGEEAIVLHNGGSVEFVARTAGSGRGFTVDVLILDEAQALTEDHLEALQPTISSAPLGNPQTIMTGTPPKDLTKGDAWVRMRGAGHARKSRRMSWHEWSCKGTVDPFDRRYWYEANPSLGKRLHLSVVEDEMPPAMTVDGFMRERLGVWRDPEDQSGVFPIGAWDALRDESARPTSDVAIAIDVTPDGSAASIGYCGRTVDGLFAVDSDYTRDLRRVVERVTERVDALGVKGPIVLCGRTAVAFKDDLIAAKLDVLVMSATEMVAACSQLWSSVVGSPEFEDEGGEIHPATDPDLRHPGRKHINAAVAGATQKNVPDGWYWNRRGPVDISPLVAVTGARWAFARLADYDMDAAIAGIW